MPVGSRASKTTVSEIKLNLPSIPTAESQQKPVKIKKIKPSPIKEQTPKLRSAMDCKTGSVNTISIHTLDQSHDKRYIKVPEKVTTQLVNISNSKSTPPIKNRGLDFTSSTNDHFDGWVFAVPRTFKRKCSASSNTDAGKSSSIKSSISPQVETSYEKQHTSEELKDDHHKGSKQKLNLKGPEWVAPCKESFVAGRPRPYIGTCPPNFEDIAKLSKPRQKFFLTQDPRKQYCLRNPEALRVKAYSKKKEFNTMAKMVKQADNICMPSASEGSESFICDVIDLENPMELDFQGMDYTNTYELDEQDIQNQQMYRRIVRYMERRRVKAETVQLVEEEMQRNRLKVPDFFAVQNREIDSSSTTTTDDGGHFGKLYRATDKPFNKERIAEEERRRHERYKEMYLRRKAKNEKLRKQREAELEKEKDRLPTTLAAKNFEAALATINDAIQRSFKKERLLRRPEVQRRLFPHTMHETMRFKKELKMQNRIKHDEAKIKKEFFKERLDKDKKYPEENLEFSDTPKHGQSESTTSEQSSNDEDKLEVGKTGDVFMLRGFQFKLGDGLRGKNHQDHHHKEKGCITREQWLSQLAPKKEHVELDVEKGIEKTRHPDDPQLVLFHPNFGFKVPKIEESGVKRYREKRLGRHYDRILRKNLKIVKPRLRYSVKKFNLISFLYGDDTKRLVQIDDAGKHMEMRAKKLETTLEYMEKKDKEKKEKLLEHKHKRLELLGIPCKEIKKSRLQTMCELSESSSDSDWVPEPEPDYEESTQMPKIDTILPLRMRGNMPAPRVRDSTLRRHPRKPRNYAAERVPSKLFDQAVHDSGLPHMIKLTEDVQTFANVRVKKRPYTDLFEARHHHDHWKPTQAKKVDVHYQAQIVTADITKIKTKADHQVIENFRMANPPCNAYVDMNLTMPNYDFDGMISKFAEQNKQRTKQADVERTKDICQPKDFIFHSRPDRDKEEFGQFPGHQEYLNMLQEIKTLLYESTTTQKANTDNESEKENLLVDRAALVNELEEDLKSIESCLTSLSSSECTNLTNDSGSFLLMEGKTKVPLDYVRKSLVPFEELQRSRFHAVPIDVDAEDADPYKVMPFPGQRKEQLEVIGPRDSFFTFNSRLKNGLRLRLEVPVEDVRQKLLGRGQHKYYGAVTTDIDENYVDELKNRPPVKMFNFKTCRSMIKDALRLKFESMLIQGQIVRTKIYDRLNEQHWEQMQKTKLLYEKLFAKWEKKEYDASMAVVYQVKTYYDITDVLKREYRELERQLLLLTMDIVYIEGDWIRRLMLQNFHYLLADQDWRYANDWIHRLEDDPNELENFEVSIAKRTQVNIRQREKDDAWAIKTFYEEQYLKNKHPILIVFPDADSFLKGIENLKAKTFVLLLELHFTLSIHTELQGRLETFEEWCIQDLKEKEEYVERKCAKKYFMSDRANELEKRTLEFLEEPIESSFNDETFNRDRAVVAEVWRQIVPANIRGSSDSDLKPIDMVAMMSDVLLELLAKFETIPVEKCRKIEAELRKSRAYQSKLSYQAYQTEKRIEMEMKKVRRNLEPPYRRPKRTGRLPRTFIKKRVVKEVEQVKPISEHTKFFFRAFHEEGDVSQLPEARESLFVMDTIQEQIVPFYFDHFLKLNGYTPNYNFKTQIELRDGPELDRLQVREVVPELLQKLEKWEINRKRIMEENIQRNPKMYENVNL